MKKTEKLQRDIAESLELLQFIGNQIYNHEAPESAPKEYSFEKLYALIKYFLFLLKCKVICYFRKRKLARCQKELKKRGIYDNATTII